MRHDGKAAQSCGMKLLKGHPITDHMLCVISHHGKKEGQKVSTVARDAQGTQSKPARSFCFQHHYDQTFPCALCVTHSADKNFLLGEEGFSSFHGGARASDMKVYQATARRKVV